MICALNSCSIAKVCIKISCIQFKKILKKKLCDPLFVKIRIRRKNVAVSFVNQIIGLLQRFTSDTNSENQELLNSVKSDMLNLWVNVCEKYVRSKPDYERRVKFDREQIK